MMFGPVLGGAVAHTVGVANAIARGGTRVRALLLHKHEHISHDVIQYEVPLGSVAAYPYELNFHIRHRRFLRVADRHFREFQPDYIYQRYCLNDLTGPLLRRRFRVPLVMEFNGSEVWVQRHWGKPLYFERIAAYIERASLRAADLVVVVSEEIKKQVLEAGVPKNRILFYPNCVDPEIFNPELYSAGKIEEIRRSLGVPVDSDLFTFVGTFGRWHGTDVLAAAIRALVDRDPAWLKSRRPHFMYVGDGPFAAQVKATLTDLNASGFVTYAGYTDTGRVPGILAASNVLISPHVSNEDGSPFFGSPTKLFEYMAMAKPIIASDLDQIGQILKGWQPGTVFIEDPDEPRAAILVKPGDVEQLAQAIRRVSDMAPEERDEYGRRAREMVCKYFTWDGYFEAMIEKSESLSATTEARDGGERESPASTTARLNNSPLRNKAGKDAA
jgi:glycosyltransferase involved in cell wall biosynthesis